MAVANGLVDQLGTLDDAIAEAKKLAGVKPDEKVDLLDPAQAQGPARATAGRLDRSRPKPAPSRPNWSKPCKTAARPAQTVRRAGRDGDAVSGAVQVGLRLETRGSRSDRRRPLAAGLLFVVANTGGDQPPRIDLKSQASGLQPRILCIGSAGHLRCGLPGEVRVLDLPSRHACLTRPPRAVSVFSFGLWPLSHKDPSMQRNWKTRTLRIALAAAWPSWRRPARAAEPLRWKFKSGEQLNYILARQMEGKLNLSGADITFKVDMTFDTTWKVKSVAADGSAEIEQTVDRIQINMSSPLGGNLDYDSAKPVKPGPAWGADGADGRHDRPDVQVEDQPVGQSDRHRASRKAGRDLHQAEPGGRPPARHGHRQQSVLRTGRQGTFGKGRAAAARGGAGRGRQPGSSISKRPFRGSARRSATSRSRSPARKSWTARTWPRFQPSPN